MGGQQRRGHQVLPRRGHHAHCTRAPAAQVPCPVVLDLPRDAAACWSHADAVSCPTQPLVTPAATQGRVHHLQVPRQGPHSPLGPGHWRRWHRYWPGHLWLQDYLGACLLNSAIRWWWRRYIKPLMAINQPLSQRDQTAAWCTVSCTTRSLSFPALQCTHRLLLQPPDTPTPLSLLRCWALTSCT